MKLPWRRKIEQKEERIEQLEQEVERLEEERDSLRQRFEAEKERRSELARKKQEAEEELNRLNDRLASVRDEEEQEPEEDGLELVDFGFEKTRRLLRKLDSLESPEDDLVTVLSPGKVEDVEDFKGLKNAVDADSLRTLLSLESFAAFLEPEAFQVIIKTRPFFGGEWGLENTFTAGPLLEFIQQEKTWALVSAGETRIYEEEAGSYEEVETVKSRVDRQHSKGGFSQDRFERKREEQVEEHLEQVEDALEDRDNIYLLGEKSLCEELPGEYLGGFDPNASPPEVFYSFQLVR